MEYMPKMNIGQLCVIYLKKKFGKKPNRKFDYIIYKYIYICRYI